MKLEERVGGFVVPREGTSMEAGQALADHLTGAGFPCEVLADAREHAEITLVHVPGGDGDGPVVILLHHPSDADVRYVVRQYQMAILAPHRPLFCAADMPPADVAFVFEGPIAVAEGALRQISLDRPLGFAAEAARIARPVLEQLAGRPLDPAKGLAFLERADAMVLEWRPYGPGEPAYDDAVYPLYTLMGLGMLCIESARSLLGDIELGAITEQGVWESADSLGEVHGLPAVGIPGEGALNLTRVLVKRWFAGRGESARELWDAWTAMRPADGD